MFCSPIKHLVRRCAAGAIATLLVALAGATLPAQCCVSGISTRTYSQGCNPVTVIPPILTAGYNMRLHALVVRVRDMTCCNAYAMDQVLVLGANPANLPLPQIGPGCTLLVQPFLALVQSASVCCDPFTIPLPAGIQPGVFFAQGALYFHPTATAAGGMALTAGLEIVLL